MCKERSLYARQSKAGFVVTVFRFRSALKKGASYPGLRRVCQALLYCACMGAVTGLQAQETGTTDPTQSLVLPVDALPTESFAYYRELLESSAAAIGVNLKLAMRDPVPQPRMMWNLEHGITALRPLLQNAERDQAFTPVAVDLTGGRVGQRVLLVAAAHRDLFQDVHSLHDLQSLGARAGMGKGWFDVDVWHANHLQVTPVAGDWTHIFSMLRAGLRGIDYFPRGVTEVSAGPQVPPGLVVEPHLLLVYDRDFRFYLSRPYARYKQLLEKALHKAKASGLMQSLQEKYWGASVQALHLPDRDVIHLALPPRS